MMKNIKRTFAALFSLCLVLACSVTAFAKSDYRLIDDAKLYISDENGNVSDDSLYIQVTNTLQNVYDETGWDVILYTNENGVEADDMEDYCNNYYDSHGFGRKEDCRGIFLTVDMGSRQMWVITKGETMYYFNDARIDNLLDDVQYYLADGDYYTAALTFAEDVLQAYNDGTPTEGKFSNLELAEKEKNPLLYVIKHNGIFILIAACGIALIAAVLVKLRYKNNGKENIYNLAENSTVNLTEKSDTFLSKNVAVTTVSDSSSNGSSHSSNSGGSSSHGGGGRSF